MRQLVADVTDPQCAFGTVLVYDVSRWGRFQNTDASAYYEYHCLVHGVQVIYVAAAFSTDPGPFSALLKNLKRAMAAEYSRELAVKVRAGIERVVAQGFSVGGQPAIGLVVYLGSNMEQLMPTTIRGHCLWVTPAQSRRHAADFAPEPVRPDAVECRHDAIAVHLQQGRHAFLPWADSIIMIAVSAWTGKGVVQAARQVGFDAYLAKPANPVHVLGLLRGRAAKDHFGVLEAERYWMQQRLASREMAMVI